jgi:hypothetical protein
MNDALARINALTEEQRSAAFDAARERIAGRKPHVDDYAAHTSARFPRWVTRTIYALCVVMLAAAFLPSAIRLHEVGRSTFAETIAHSMSVYVAALCVVLMAETGQIIFSLASATINARWQRIGFIAGALICTCIALSGNAVAVGMHATENAFAVLETFAPPVLVLLTAQILKSQMLHAIEAKHAARVAYTQALNAWKAVHENAHLGDSWQRVSANALKDALRSANKRSTAVLRELTDTDWRELVLREWNADAWYVRAESVHQAQAESERIARERAQVERENAEAVRLQRLQERALTRALRVQPVGKVSGIRTGETHGQVHVRDDGQYVATCPHCSTAFVKPTEKGAKNALSAHVGRFCKVRNVNALSDTQPSEPVDVEAEV